MESKVPASASVAVTVGLTAVYPSGVVPIGPDGEDTEPPEPSDQDPESGPNVSAA